MVVEAARLAALRSYGVLDTPNEPEFDRIVLALAQAMKVPSALVSFIDEHRQWYKARVGVEVSFVPRTISFCTHSIGTDEVTVVPDARLDQRFCDNPFVTAERGIRFYAAAPIKTPAGARIGTVCAFDTAPRVALAERQRRHLSSCAAEVTDLLERRRTAAAQVPPAAAVPS